MFGLRANGNLSFSIIIAKKAHGKLDYYLRTPAGEEL